MQDIVNNAKPIRMKGKKRNGYSISRVINNGMITVLAHNGCVGNKGDGKQQRDVVVSSYVPTDRLYIESFQVVGANSGPVIRVVAVRLLLLLLCVDESLVTTRKKEIAPLLKTS